MTFKRLAAIFDALANFGLNVGALESLVFEFDHRLYLPVVLSDERKGFDDNVTHTHVKDRKLDGATVPFGQGYERSRNQPTKRISIEQPLTLGTA